MRNNSPSDIHTLLEIMAQLRDPETGCPWDVKQDFASIAAYTIEEAYEVADAIVRSDMHGLRDELGDLLLQVVFHSRMAEEQRQFTFAQVVESIVDKMIRRHPHVFGEEEAADAHAVKRSWEAIKAKERAARGEQNASELDGLSSGMPALIRAMKIQQRVAGVGFDWPDARGAMEKVREETQELAEELGRGGDTQRLSQEVGDLMFSVVNLARHLDVDPEMALAGCNARFEARFRHLEREVDDSEDARPLSARSIDELEALWRNAKKEIG